MGNKCVITIGDMGQDFTKQFNRAKELGLDVVWASDVANTVDVDKIVNACSDADYVIAGLETWTKEAMEKCKNLKAIVRFGVGYDHVDLVGATEKGIAVFNVPGANASSVAEHAATLILACSRHLTYQDKYMKLQQSDKANFCTHCISGATVGILGFGNIGKKLAVKLSGFGCNFIAYDPFHDEEFAKAHNVKYVSQEEVLENSDYISIHLPVTPETSDLICKQTIEKMKPGVCIINTSRGGVVNSKDLAEALRSNKVRFAGLDVFDDEGRSDVSVGHEFSGLENVVLTPHTSTVTYECMYDMMDACIDIVDKFRNGEEIRSLLNKDYVAKVI